MCLCYSVEDTKVLEHFGHELYFQHDLAINEQRNDPFWIQMRVEDVGGEHVLTRVSRTVVHRAT